MTLTLGEGHAGIPHQVGNKYPNIQTSLCSLPLTSCECPLAKPYWGLLMLFT